MSSFAEAERLLKPDQYAAALAVAQAIIPTAPHEVVRRFLFIAVCEQGRQDHAAAYAAFEAGRASALDTNDDHAVVLLDGFAASTLIALGQHRLLTGRLTTDLTRPFPISRPRRSPSSPMSATSGCGRTRAQRGNRKPHASTMPSRSPSLSAIRPRTCVRSSRKWSRGCAR